MYIHTHKSICIDVLTLCGFALDGLRQLLAAALYRGGYGWGCRNMYIYIYLCSYPSWICSSPALAAFCGFAIPGGGYGWGCRNISVYMCLPLEDLLFTSFGSFMRLRFLSSFGIYVYIYIYIHIYIYI